MTPDVIADSAVSLAAAAGLLLVMARLQNADPLSRRFRLALSGLVILMIVRTLAWITGIGLFDALTTIVAGAVPLYGLIVTEGMLRRHAPPALKWAALIGALAFAVIAPIPVAVVEPARSYLLLLYQVSMIAGLGILAGSRDRSSLSPEENRAIDRLLLSLLLILPLIASDFRTPLVDTPVRLGGIAILGLAWLSLGLGRATSSPTGVIMGFLALCALSLVITVVVAALIRVSPREAVQIGAIVLSGCLVFAIGKEVHSLRTEARADTVLRHLAEGSLASPQAFLAELQARTGVEEVAFLTGEDLADLEAEDLLRCFDADPVQTRATASALAQGAGEQIAFLLDRFEATHLLLITDAPLTVLALNRPAIGGSDVALLELRAVQRMAALIARSTARQT